MTGLKDSTAERALDQYFDRIQNMMFIRVIRTNAADQPMHDDKGDAVTEDDDCESSGRLIRACKLIETIFVKS